MLKLLGSKILLLVLFLVFGLISLNCGQDFNSNSYDGLTGGTCESSEPYFCESLQILNDTCVRCHTGEHQAWSVYTTSTDYVNADLVTPGDVQNSILITKLKLHDPPGNMPPANGDYTLTQSDYDTLVMWVESL